jgi:hypothetical protein
MLRSEAQMSGLDPEAGHGAKAGPKIPGTNDVERCESPLRSLQLASAATANGGGSAYKNDLSPTREHSIMVLCRP